MKYSVTLISVCDTLRQLTLLPKKMRNEPSFQVFLMIIICKIKIEKLEKTVVWSLAVTVGIDKSKNLQNKSFIEKRRINSSQQ